MKNKKISILFNLLLNNLKQKLFLFSFLRDLFLLQYFKITILFIIGLFTLSSCTTVNKQINYKITEKFINEQKVNIIGYNDDAMEPFISKDDKYLFFNNLKGPGNKDIFYAIKINDTTFKFMGEVKGVNSPYVDANPTMDSEYNFYFISTRSLKKGDTGTIYCGKFKNGLVMGLHKIKGTINIKKPFHINMGVEVSYNGEILFVSNAVFKKGQRFPYKGDIRFGVKHKNKFDLPSDEMYILKNINTNYAIEYAGELSPDGLELFFSQVLLSNPPIFRLLYARRNSTNEPFEFPMLIIEPFKNNKYAIVEAPTISYDGKKLYYHKLDKNGKFSIFMLSRKTKNSY